MSAFKDLLTKRRSHYAIGANTDVTASDVTAALYEVIPTVPSAFNSQGVRVVVVSGEKNQQLWDLIPAVPSAFNSEGVGVAVVSGENDQQLWDLIKGVQTEVLVACTLHYMTPTMDGAREAVGTILFFEDRDAVEAGIPGNPERRSVYK